MGIAEAEKKVLKQLVELNRPEAMTNAMVALQPAMDYEQAFEIVNEMQNKNLVKIVYCVAPNVINIQLTRVGQQWYLNNQQA